MITKNEVLHSLKPGLELMDDAVLVTTADPEPLGPRVVFVNRAFVKLAGHSVYNILGETLRVLCDREIDSDLLDELLKELKEDRWRASGSDVSREDGSQSIAEWQVVPLLDETGTVHHWLCIHRDMRRLWDAKHRRMGMDESNRQLIEKQPEPVCRFLPDTELTYVNAAYADLFHFRPRDLIGKRLTDIVAADDVAAIRTHLASFTPDESMGQFEYKNVRKDGKARWHLWNTFASFDDAEKISSVQSVGTDITLRREAEEALRLKPSVDGFHQSRTVPIYCGRFGKGGVQQASRRLARAVTESEFGFIGEIFRTRRRAAVYQNPCHHKHRLG